MFKLLRKEDFLVMVKVENSLKKDIELAVNIVQDIESGNESSFENQNTNNSPLISSLIKLKQKLNEIKTEEKERHWVTEGVALFSDIIRKSHTNISTFSDAIISWIVNYSQSNQGGIFIFNESENLLELTGCYAYGRKKYNEKTIAPGEGLIGQCFLEKEPVFITDIPTNYIHITSGLGEATPRSLILIPLLINDQIFGVIELASFEVYKDFQIELLTKIAESIAGAIKNVKTSENTHHLLDASQELTAQLRNQEEEMRQNMEELQSTQEELVRKDIENNKIIEKLRAEYEAILQENKTREDQLITIKNELIQKLTGNNALIDIAGRQRMLSQKIGFYSEMIARGKFDIHPMLTSAIELFESTLYVIKNGGLAPGLTTVETIPSADDTVLLSLNMVELLWDKYAFNARYIASVGKENKYEKLNSKEISEAIEYIESNGEELLQQSNKLLQVCSNSTKEKLVRMYSQTT